MPYRKPRYVEAVDWGNPLAQGLIFATHVGVNMHPVDYVTGLVGVPSGTTFTSGIATVAGGKVLTGTDAQYVLTKNVASTAIFWPKGQTRFDKQITGSPYTILCVASSAGGSGTADPIFGKDDSISTGNSHFARIDFAGIANNGVVIAKCNGSNIVCSAANALTSSPQNKVHAFGTGFDGTNAFGYHSGDTKFNGGAASHTFQADYQTSFFHLFTVYATAGSGASYAYVWNRCLTLQEYANWYQDPGALLRLPARRRIISQVAAGGDTLFAQACL